MLVINAIISVIYAKSLNIMLYMYLGVFRYAYPQIYKTIRRPMF